jgi:ABC-type multidrug transport system fused ATPase/permease subunit
MINCRGERQEAQMGIASFSFLDVMWSMLVFFAYIVFFVLLITIFIDIFKRHDIGGWKKFFWIVFCVILPFIGVFTYIIVNSHSMAERNQREAAEDKKQFDSYVREVSSTSSTTEIAQAKQLLDQGTINQAEFDQIKARALGSK